MIFSSEVGTSGGSNLFLKMGRKTYNRDRPYGLDSHKSPYFSTITVPIFDEEQMSRDGEIVKHYCMVFGRHTSGYKIKIFRVVNFDVLFLVISELALHCSYL
jgi:hypothetical protein